MAYFWFTHDLLALGARTHTGNEEEDSLSLVQTTKNSPGPLICSLRHHRPRFPPFLFSSTILSLPPSDQVKPGPQTDPSSLLSETLVKRARLLHRSETTITTGSGRDPPLRGANCPRGRGCTDCREEERVISEVDSRRHAFH